MNGLEPLAYRDGDLVPLRELAVPVWDLGLIHGICVSEQVRTFGGRPFLLERHYERWLSGLELVGISPPCDFDTLSQRLVDLIARNARLLTSETEQGICFFATPGNHRPFLWTSVGEQSKQTDSEMPREFRNTMNKPRFFAHTYPLDTAGWQENYRNGVTLSTTSIRDVPAECWPSSVKIRSRLHYYLAQQQSVERQPEAFPLLLDQNNSVSDSSIGSVVGFLEGQGIVVRPRAKRFHSVTVDFLIEIAEELAIPIIEAEFTVEELYRFDEILLVSTPWCIFPVAQVDHQRIKRGMRDNPQSFTLFQRLLNAWRAKVGVSIIDEPAF